VQDLEHLEWRISHTFIPTCSFQYFTAPILPSAILNRVGRKKSSYKYRTTREILGCNPLKSFVAFLSSSVSIHHAPSTINFVTAAVTFSSLGYKKYKTGFSQSSSISPLGKKKSNNFERREEFYDPATCATKCNGKSDRR
jgi:hypothetical protein